MKSIKPNSNPKSCCTREIIAEIIEEISPIMKFIIPDTNPIICCIKPIIEETSPAMKFNTAPSKFKSCSTAVNRMPNNFKIPSS